MKRTFKTCSLVGAAEQVYNVKSLVAELFNCLFAKLVPYFCGDRLVVILIFFGGAPYGVFCNLVFLRDICLWENDLCKRL